MLRAINVKTKNRLFVVFCACSAFYINGEIEPNKPAPFSVCVSPYSKLTLQEIEQILPEFYRALMVDYDFLNAIQQVRSAYEYSSSELFIKDVLVKMICRNMGKKGRQHRENLLTEAVKRSLRPINLKQARSTIKRNWTLTDDNLRILSENYMCGREFQYSASELIDEARKKLNQDLKA